MTCRSCGHTIADNAIVCYKCGAPTAIPEVKRAVPSASSGSRPSRSGLVAACVFLVMAVLMLMRTTAGSWLRWGDGAVVAALVVAILVLVRRR
jgi:hypothetical protein